MAGGRPDARRRSGRRHEPEKGPSAQPPGTSGSAQPPRDRRPPRPPLLGRLLLRLRWLGARREEIEADFYELFLERTAERGRRYAALRYCGDAASLWIHRSEGGKRTSQTRQARGVMTSSNPRITFPKSAGTAAARLLDGLLLDVRFAVRTFRGRIGAVSVAVAGLALAIGATSVVFGIADILLLPPLDSLGPNASSVVELSWMSAGGPRSMGQTDARYRQLRDAARLTVLEAYVRERAPFGEAGSEEEIRVTLVSGGFFETLGVGAAVGRVLKPDDDRADAAPAVVVNHTFWKRRFGEDPSLVGRTVRLMGAPFTVVGVVEEGFAGPTGGAEPAHFWAPLATYRDAWNRDSAQPFYVHVIGRVVRDSTREQAEDELAALVAAADALDAVESDTRNEPLHITLAPPFDRGQDPTARWVLVVIVTILSLVLLLACANVTNLLLAAAVSRRGEVAVRLALGASRWRVARQLMTECAMLGALGGGAGLLAVLWLLPLVVASLPFSATIDPTPDIRVYAFVAASTLLAGLAAGLAPARYGARGDLAAPLKGVAASGTGSAGRTRSMLVAAQAAASILLLVLAVLLTRAMFNVTRADLGFDVDRLLTVSPDFRAGGYDDARAADYWERAAARVSGLSGVERVGIVRYAPFGGAYGRMARLRRAGRELRVYFNETSADYFAAMGIPLLRGRTYTTDEVANGAAVAVITESLSRTLWGGDEPLGASLASLDRRLMDTRVIGVVSDAISLRFDADATFLYLPLSPADAAAGQLVVRAHEGAAAIVGPVLEAMRALGPEVLPTATTVREDVRSESLSQRMFAATAVALGAVALGLAVIGVFGVTAFAVAQRTAEIGVRLAIGARPGDVVRLMLRDNLRPVAAGLIIGLLLALAGGRILTAVLYGISPYDPLSMLAAVSILLLAATLAAALPTRRATRVDPAAVLRSQ